MTFVIYADDYEDGYREFPGLDAALDEAKGLWHPGSIWRRVAGTRDVEPIVEFEGIAAAINAGRGAAQQFEFRQ